MHLHPTQHPLVRYLRAGDIASSSSDKLVSDEDSEDEDEDEDGKDGGSDNEKDSGNTGQCRVTMPRNVLATFTAEYDDQPQVLSKEPVLDVVSSPSRITLHFSPESFSQFANFARAIIGVADQFQAIPPSSVDREADSLSRNPRSSKLKERHSDSGTRDKNSLNSSIDSQTANILDFDLDLDQSFNSRNSSPSLDNRDLSSSLSRRTPSSRLYRQRTKNRL